MIDTIKLNNERYFKEYQKLKNLNITRQKDIESWMDAFEKMDAFYLKLMDFGFPDRIDFLYQKPYYLALPRPFSKEVIDFLITNLDNPIYYIPIINLLRESKTKYDGTKIKKIFELLNFDQKWQICDSIVYNTPLFIEDWIIGKYLLSNQDTVPSDGTFMFAEIIPKISERKKAKDILLQGFFNSPSMTSSVLGKKFKDNDIYVFLSKNIDNYSPNSLAFKEIKKALLKINKELSKVKH